MTGYLRLDLRPLNSIDNGQIKRLCRCIKDIYPCQKQISDWLSPPLQWHSSLRSWSRWRIQNFLGGWVGWVGANLVIYYWAKNLPKTAWKWKNLDRGQASLAPPWIYCVVIKNIRKKARQGHRTVTHSWVWFLAMHLPRCAVADPGFPRGAPNPGDGAAGRVNLLFRIFFSEKCMKLK